MEIVAVAEERRKRSLAESGQLQALLIGSQIRRDLITEKRDDLRIPRGSGLVLNQRGQEILPLIEEETEVDGSGT